MADSRRHLFSSVLAREATLTCPLCGSPSESSELIPSWGEWRTCLSCTLDFVSPLRLPFPPEELYDAAYRGGISHSGMGEFADRMKLRQRLISSPELWFWTPAFGDILAWLRERLRPGSTVLEIGCGLGFVLHALRRNGLDAVGLDVSETVVNLNREDGFRVWHGTLQTLPRDWVTPSAVIAFFMLHHLDDPLAMLRDINARWPSTPVAIAQYGPSNRGPLNTQPPRTLTRWNRTSLDVLLTRSGYKGKIISYARAPTDNPALQPIRRLAARVLVVPSAYRMARRLERRVLSRVLPPGPDDWVLTPLAEPAI